LGLAPEVTGGPGGAAPRLPPPPPQKKQRKIVRDGEVGYGGHSILAWLYSGHQSIYF